MTNASNVYRNDSSPNLLGMHSRADQLSTDDLSCLMPDVIFPHQSSPSQQQRNASMLSMPSEGYGPLIAPRIIGIGDATGTEMHQMSRKRHLLTAQGQHEYDSGMNVIGTVTDQRPIKRSTPEAPAMPSIKPEPDSLSPFCNSILMEPSSPLNAGIIMTSTNLNGMIKNSSPPISLTIDTCSNISSCSTGSASPNHSQNVESNGTNGKSSSQQQQQSSISSDGNCSESCPMQCIRFSPFQQQNWHVLCDQSLQELLVNSNQLQ